MILRATRKRLALLIAEWRYRGQPDLAANARRSIGARYRKPGKPRTSDIGAIKLVMDADSGEHEKNMAAMERAMRGEK